MQAHNTLTKSLILACLVLSPLQALQGTHLFCCHAQQAAPDQSTCGCCHPEHTHAAGPARCVCPSARPNSGSGACGRLLVVSPQHARGPCDCPLNCGCHRAPQPQAPGEGAPRLAYPTIDSELSLHRYSPGLTFEFRVNHPERPSRVGASEVCVQLCRFLA